MSNILLIEDNEAIIMGLEYLFTNNGYNVRVARSAYQAKEILDNAKETEKYRALIGAGDVFLPANPLFLRGQRKTFGGIHAGRGHLFPDYNTQGGRR